MKKVDYKGLCWWCGKVADSREHKYKRTDLIREFGGGQYKNQGGMLRVTNERDCKVEGPKAKDLKFNKNICSECNNSKSQEFDRAYDRFIGFIKTNENAIIKTRSFELSSIFGNNWREEVKNVKRYYIKHMCCRLADGKIHIHSAIINYLNGSSHLKYVLMKMEFMEEFLAVREITKSLNKDQYGIYIDDLTCIPNKTNDSMKMISSCYQYRWLRLSYLYDRSVSTSTDNFSNNIVVLPNRPGLNAYKILFNNRST